MLAVLTFALVWLAAVAAGAQASYPGRDGLIAFAREVPPIDRSYEPPLGAWTIWVADPRTGHARELTHRPRLCRGRAEWEDTQPSFSASGRLLLYVHTDECDPRTPNGIYVMRSDGTERRLIRRDPGDGNLEFPAFSPSGDLFTFDFSGSATIAEFRPPLRERSLGPSDSRYFEPVQAAWSSTRRVALTLAEPRGHIGTLTEGARGVRLLTRSDRDAVADWSPSGHRIAFQREKVRDLENGDRHILGDVLTAQTLSRRYRRPKRLTDTRDAFFPVWSPNGRSIAYVRNSRYTFSALGSLWVMRASDGRAQRLIPISRIITDRISWQPRPRQ